MPGYYAKMHFHLLFSVIPHGSKSVGLVAQATIQRYVKQSQDNIKRDQ